jgi:hypothetical protein
MDSNTIQQHCQAQVARMQVSTVTCSRRSAGNNPDHRNTALADCPHNFKHRQRHESAALHAGAAAPAGMAIQTITALLTQPASLLTHWHGCLQQAAGHITLQSSYRAAECAYAKSAKNCPDGNLAAA